MYLKKHLYVISFLISICYCSCSFFGTGQFVCNSKSNIKNVDPLLSYETIHRLGYMGGSLPFYPEETDACPLQNNAVVAFRLGYLEKISLEDGSISYNDKIADACYGFFRIEQIDENEIILFVQVFDQHKNTLPMKTYHLHLNEDLDINGDGLLDLTYRLPTNNRIGLNKVCYLSFICSKETLNTSMFAVIPEQYENSDYPGGIIGINPNENYLLTKYNSSGARAIIENFMKGDFVLDRIEGKYQRINSSCFNGKTRAVLDSELEDIEDVVDENFYLFSESDFVDYYNPAVLVESIKTALEIEVSSEENYIEQLNLILLNRDLLPKIVQKGFLNDIIDELIVIENDLNIYTDSEIIQLNRELLKLLFPEKVPSLPCVSDSMLDILPIASICFGGEEYNTDLTSEIGNFSRQAINENDYLNKKAGMEKRFKEYQPLNKINLALPKAIPLGKGKIDITTRNSYITIGCYGTFTQIDGCIGSTVKGCVYVTADTDISANISYDKDLFSYNLGVNYPIQIYGPIILNLSANLKIAVPLKIQLSGSESLQYRAAFTGLYEAGFYVGLAYGRKTKKLGFIEIPVPYVRKNSYSIKGVDTISYSTTSGANSAKYDNSFVSIGAYAAASLGVNISKVVWGDISAGTGIYSKMGIDYKSPYLIGTLNVVPDIYLTANAYIGIKDIPIIGSLGYGWSYDIYRNNTPIFSCELFKNKL